MLAGQPITIDLAPDYALPASAASTIPTVVPTYSSYFVIYTIISVDNHI